MFDNIAVTWPVSLREALDFSYALIYAALWTFIGYMLSTYIRDCWKYATNGQRLSTTTIAICLCAAHFMKAAAMRLRKREPKKAPR